MSSDPSKRSQCDLILNYLQRGNGLTPIDALERFGCFRLAARVNDLRKRGYLIARGDVNLVNGKRCAIYYLEPTAQLGWKG